MTITKTLITTAMILIGTDTLALDTGEAFRQQTQRDNHRQMIDSLNRISNSNRPTYPTYHDFTYNNPYNNPYGY